MGYDPRAREEIKALREQVEMLEAQVKFFQEDLVAANEIIKSLHVR